MEPNPKKFIEGAELIDADILNPQHYCCNLLSADCQECSLEEIFFNDLFRNKVRNEIGLYDYGVGKERGSTFNGVHDHNHLKANRHRIIALLFAAEVAKAGPKYWPENFRT